MTPTKPNPRQRAQEIEAADEEWFDLEVVPYAQFLLSKVQARMSRHEIIFLHGNGETILDVDGKIHRPLCDALNKYNDSKKSKRYLARFPELVELFDLANDVELLFGLVLLEVNPITS